MTWEEVRGLDAARAVAILPVGAIEAHGPHLPLETDVVIAEAMAEAGAAKLEVAGLDPIVLPAFAWTAAPFAAAFPGTVSTQPEAVTALLVDIAKGVAAAGLRRFAIANAHLDPAHVASLHAAVERIRNEAKSWTAGAPFVVAFPDVTRKPWALRLGDEFKSGACHAGRYESSIVMAARPDLVKDAARRALAPNPASLSVAIRNGKRTFEEAGGPRAYFGWPADATVEEGRRLIETLGEILAEAVGEARADPV